MALNRSGGYHRLVQRTSWLTLVVLVAIGAIVVGSSLRTGAVRCEVCIEFGGRRACRSVDGATPDDARMAAVTNACALLASGVTDTVACQRTPPQRSECGPRDDPEG
jgi:hypothetical protein